MRSGQCQLFLLGASRGPEREILVLAGVFCTPAADEEGGCVVWSCDFTGRAVNLLGHLASFWATVCEAASPDLSHLEDNEFCLISFLAHVVGLYQLCACRSTQERKTDALWFLLLPCTQLPK